MPRPERISLILLADGTTTPDAIDAARAQLQPGDDLVLVERAVCSGALAWHAARLSATDPFITAVRPQPGGPPRLDDALAQCGPGRIAVLAGRLSPAALDRAAAEAGDIVFADEAGFHKPAWSIDLALERDLIGPFALFDRALLDRIGPAPVSTPHDLALHAAHAARRIIHVAEVLSSGPHPVQPGRGAVDAALRALSGRTAGAVVASALQPGHVRTAWRAVPQATVSVIIPIRDRPDLLARCLDGLLHHTAHPVHQVIIVDNGSEQPATHALLARLTEDPCVTVLAAPGPFNYAALNNRAAALATGEVLLLLNNDIEVLEPHWLDEMAGHALRPEVGAVGARLLYPDGTIQHAGIVLGVGTFEGGPGVAGHFGYGRPGDDPGYQGQFVTTREVSAVTGACLAVRREVFSRAGGLDAVNLPVALNDLDLCLRIRAMGLRVVWTPFATLRHHESASRGDEADAGKAARFRQECRFLRDRWAATLDADPFYNRHFSRFDHSFLPA